MSALDVLSQYFSRRAQRQREAEWQALDAESVRWAGILTDLPHVRDIRRRAIDSYVQNGGDLHLLHRQAALDMSGHFLAMELLMGPNIPYVVHRARYPDHERQLTLEWLRGRRWLALTSERHREELRRMRDTLLLLGGDVYNMVSCYIYSPGDLNSPSAQQQGPWGRASGPGAPAS